MLYGLIMGICFENHTKAHEYNLWETCRGFLNPNQEATYNNCYALKVNIKPDPLRGFNTNPHYSSRFSLIVPHIRHDTHTVSSPNTKATCSLASNLLPVTMKRDKKLLVAFNVPKLTLYWLEITRKCFFRIPVRTLGIMIEDFHRRYRQILRQYFHYATTESFQTLSISLFISYRIVRRCVAYFVIRMCR